MDGHNDTQFNFHYLLLPIFLMNDASMWSRCHLCDPKQNMSFTEHQMMNKWLKIFIVLTLSFHMRIGVFLLLQKHFRNDKPTKPTEAALWRKQNYWRSLNQVIAVATRAIPTLIGLQGGESKTLSLLWCGVLRNLFLHLHGFSILTWLICTLLNMYFCVLTYSIQNRPQLWLFSLHQVLEFLCWLKVIINNEIFMF